jgi:two-component system sensor histidine kinase/response regulator
LLYEAYENFDESQRKNFIKNICEASESTFKLLQNLLDWSRTQTGNIDFHPTVIDLSIIANEYMSLLRSSAEGKQITLKMNIPFNTIAFADENMIKTVVRNLLSNAVKFTNSGGKVEITAKKNHDKITICVIDNGVGIEEENLRKIFRIDEHYRTTGTSNEMGTGLGLILCREFVEKNNGKIWAESKPGEGSTFCFMLPSTGE